MKCKWVKCWYSYLVITDYLETTCCDHCWQCFVFTQAVNQMFIYSLKACVLPSYLWHFVFESGWHGNSQSVTIKDLSVWNIYVNNKFIHYMACINVCSSIHNSHLYSIVSYRNSKGFCVHFASCSNSAQASFLRTDITLCEQTVTYLRFRKGRKISLE